MDSSAQKHRKFQIEIITAFDQGRQLSYNTRRHVERCPDCQQFLEIIQKLKQHKTTKRKGCPPPIVLLKHAIKHGFPDLEANRTSHLHELPLEKSPDKIRQHLQACAHCRNQYRLLHDDAQSAMQLMDSVASEFARTQPEPSIDHSSHERAFTQTILANTDAKFSSFPNFQSHFLSALRAQTLALVTIAALVIAVAGVFAFRNIQAGGDVRHSIYLNQSDLDLFSPIRSGNADIDLQKLGIEALNNGDFDKAIAYLEKEIATTQPTSKRDNLVLALGIAHLGRAQSSILGFHFVKDKTETEKAIRLFQTLIINNVDDRKQLHVVAEAYLARAFYTLGDKKQARYFAELAAGQTANQGERQIGLQIISAIDGQ